MSLSELKHTQTLLTHHGFAMQCWDDPYGKGTWVAISPDEHLLENIRRLTGTGDLDVVPVVAYLLSTDWLPCILATDFITALNALEQRLTDLATHANLGRESAWAHAVAKALDQLNDAYIAHRDYGTIDQSLQTLPRTFLAA